MNFPPIQPINSATPWNALPEAIQSGVNSYWQQKTLQMMLQQKIMQQMLQSSEIDKNQMQVKAIRGKVVGVPDAANPGYDLQGNPLNVSGSQPAEPTTASTSAANPTAAAPVFKVPGAAPAGVSPLDWSKTLAGEARDAARIKATYGSNGGIPRGLASILRSSGLQPSEISRFDGATSAIPIHNQITDAITALERNDTSVSKSVVQNYISQHPNLSGFFQDYKANPNNQAALYNALTRLGSIEQFKLQNGSQAMPTEESIIHNQGIYPTQQEIAAKSPVVAQKLNALVDTTIKPAISGPMSRIALMRDTNGNFPAPIIGTIYNNLNSGLQQLDTKIKGLPGYTMQNAEMQIPSSQSGLPLPSAGNHPGPAAPTAGAPDYSKVFGGQ